MKSKLLQTSIIIIFLCGIVFIGLAQRDFAVAAQASSDKIEGQLADQIAANDSADFIVRFTEQADLSPAYSMDWAARGEFVYNTLSETAARSQVNAKAILDAQGLAYQTFFAGNDLYVYGGSQPSTKGMVVLDALAALPEVSFIRAAKTYYIDPIAIINPLEDAHWAGDLLANHELTTVGASPQATTDWGIIDTKANQAWSLGARGSGIKVASIDTGVQWNHPALINQFACPGDPTNANCWADPSNICGASGACDNVGHGTHTMGTMVGKDNPALSYVVGMAPDATWIACKGCEGNSCSSFALNTCADWILAPGGNSGNRPNVVNNSWGGGGGDTWFQAKVQAWRAAGIFPAFSAGNDGPNCTTLGSPGDYQESFASAAHDVNRNIASFSSRGPSAFGHTPYTKPNISAPGVSICSTIPGSLWSCGYSGTSMASPHTAGAVAQLWSCAPSLVGQVDATFQSLQNSADTPLAGTCGVPPDGQGNYTYGYGYLDVLNLVSLNCGNPALGTLQGHVYDQNNNPITGAMVTAILVSQGKSVNAFTDPTGFYTTKLAAGTYNITASKTNYSPQTISGIVITTNQTTTQDFTIVQQRTWTEIPLPVSCPDWNRFDGEYYPLTGKVYFMGGRSGTTTYGTIYSYNPVSNTCVNTGASMLTAISNYTINLVNNGVNDLLCTFGGRDSSGAQTLAVQCYNPVANTVSVVNNLPTAWTDYGTYATVVVNNKVYIFGGFRSTTTPYMLARTDRYDPVLNTFTQMGNMSIARSYIMAAAVDGKIYAFGGNVWDGVNLNAQTIAEVFNPLTQSWDDASIANLPTASGEGRAYGFNTSSSSPLAGKIVIAGGGQWPNDTNEVLAYDVATNTYESSVPNLNISRRDQAGFFIPGDPGAMWVFGGHSGSDNPPYAPPEYYHVFTPKYNYLPIIYR